MQNTSAQSTLIHSDSAITVRLDLFCFYLDLLYEDKDIITIQLPNIPGTKRYEVYCDNHLRSCHDALFIKDSTNIESLEQAEKHWNKQLQIKGDEHVETIVVCNKMDLVEEEFGNE